MVLHEISSQMIDWLAQRRVRLCGEALGTAREGINVRANRHIKEIKFNYHDRKENEHEKE
jgi:hypothetical protein